MTRAALAKMRILVIEDKAHQRDLFVRLIKRTPQHLKELKGVGDFEIYEADSYESAVRLLKELTTPLHLVLLDLQLPDREPGDGTEEVENGHKLLKLITESGAAGGVVIVSIFSEYKDVAPSFRGGALDFYSKTSLKEEELQTCVLNALSRVLAEESSRIVNRRVRDLASYAELGLVHNFKVVFKNLDDGVTKAADGIEKYARDRLHLDGETSPNDPLLSHLRTHRKVVSEARRDWAALQAELSAGGKENNVGQLKCILGDIKASLLPCLAVKRVAFEQADFDDKPVMTFENDVAIVLREIALGALCEMPDYGEVTPLRVDVSTEETLAVVRFEDRLRPIPEDKVRAVNERQRVIPDAEFGRVWGLSVAQHVALRGGGSLGVAVGEGKNVITYRIPM